ICTKYKCLIFNEAVKCFGLTILAMSTKSKITRKLRFKKQGISLFIKMSSAISPEKEKEAIIALREKALDVLTGDQSEDFFLRKWLIAQNFDLVKAETMLRQHIKFMRTRGLDKIDESYVPPKATDYFHTRFLGYDNEGSVVRMLHLGATDIRGMALSISKIDSIRFATFIILGDGRRQRRERANDIICHKQVYIFDLLGLNWTSIIQRSVIEKTFMLLTNYEKNHPESLKIVYVINVVCSKAVDWHVKHLTLGYIWSWPYSLYLTNQSSSFLLLNFIHNWLKTVLPASILSKVHLVPKEKCSELLGKYIDLSIVPASVGGTMVDENGDPNCPSW
ncbi:SEC14-like protein 2, partial [Caerostris extrusa]